MRLSKKEYTSYKTHNFCSAEVMWILKKESLGAYCPSCGHKIRKKPKFYSGDKWEGAY